MKIEIDIGRVLVAGLPVLLHHLIERAARARSSRAERAANGAERRLGAPLHGRTGAEWLRLAVQQLALVAARAARVRRAHGGVPVGVQIGKVV